MVSTAPYITQIWKPCRFFGNRLEMPRLITLLFLLMVGGSTAAVITPSKGPRGRGELLSGKSDTQELFLKRYSTVCRGYGSIIQSCVKVTEVITYAGSTHECAF